MRTLRNPRFWVACTASSVLLALIETFATHSDAVRAGRESHIGVLLIERLLADSVWVIVAAIVFARMSRAIASEATVKRIIVEFAVLGILLAPVYIASDGLAYAVADDASLAAIGLRLRHTAHLVLVWRSFLYLLVALTCFAILQNLRSRQRAEESRDLRARLAQVELELLRSQLEPHFLFNALNTVAGLIRSRQHEVATTALAELSHLLRYVIEASRQERVPLAWETQFASNYLRLQQLRYGPRLQFVIQEDPAARGFDVPPLLLQPLIENAVVHGAARMTEPAHIRVCFTLDTSVLHIEVENTRAPRVNPQRTTGVGLNITRRRLERIYGDSVTLNAGTDGPQRYRVTISLPRVSSL